ncbi:engulfment and cell motility protein 1 [Pectinophora gossypiella]|uniref:ELMO domain-containing protein n=1 Tax=Pectinophora gossypiella TaxID=13191 RepID=A0A1E1W7S9_PECGO|nr:engulfment and cell motility protein 1 [Pectinophora gossypiella]
MSTKPIKMPAATKDSTILKIAVEMLNAPDKVPQLIEFDQSQPLSSIIQELCERWGLPDPDNYALQFSESNNQNYITEKNRNAIKNGSVLRLEFSPAKTVQDILTKINSGVETDQTAALSKLSTASSDLTFACEFINKKGLSLIINNIESGKFKSAALKYALITFVELMDHGIISWDILENQFINKVASFVNNQSSTQDPQVIQSCLSILENIVLNSSGKNAHVEKEITIPNLVSHLQNKDSIIQQNAIALINAIFSKADMTKRKTIAATLASKQVRLVIYENLIGAADFSKNASKDALGTELAHQLYVLQTLMLGLLEPKMRQRADSQEQESQEKIKELRKIAFENDNSFNIEVTTRRQLGSFSKDFKKLGFKCEIDPIKDFNEVPPGVLGLDCMLYFARNYPEHYTKIVLENSCRADEHECPFGKTSVELVKQLCDILHIGDPPSEQGQTYHPLFFTHDHPFEELFCVCIVILNKTWKEMRATTEDFVKVSSVVREQISRSLACSPKGFDKFRQKINQLTYADLTNIWLQERTNREVWESHATPIVELKEKITPEIIELIQQQRLGVLVGGTRFKKYSSRGQRIKDKFWFVRLSPNHKVLHYGDCDEKSTPSLEELGTKLAVTDIKCVVVGKECPHMKDLRGRKINAHLAFSLILKSNEVTSLDFVAPDEQVFDYWTDGINALLKEKMCSNSFNNDLETLLSMDIKVRLLDAEGIDIPQDPPQIPDEPEDYDFYYDNN